MTQPDSLFAIRTPLRSEGGLTYGGMLRVKTRAGPAYLACRSEALAGEVAAHWGFEHRAKIEAWGDALQYEPPESRAGLLLVLTDTEDFHDFLTNRGAYRFESRLVPLGPSGVI